MSTKKNSVDLSTSPLIPEIVYQQLPPFLKELCSQFQPSRERDVFLTGIWGVVGGCITNVLGRYKDGSYYPDLYAIIVAPPASGKGTLTLIKLLGIPIQNSLNDNGSQEAEIQSEDKEIGVDTVNSNTDRLLFIPADTSASMFIELLNRNGGRGIIFETEVDTLANTLSQDWGLIDDKLRKGFQHEAISFARKTEKTVVKIDKPRISLVMSGTLGQITKLIRSTENGLFSRIIFYVYRSAFKWISVEPCYTCTNPEVFFLEKGEELLRIVQHCETYPAEFVLSKEQWQKFDAFFEPLMQEHPLLHGDDASGVVARMGLITFRIAMIISVFRRWENKSTEAQLICSDQDFTSALKLGEVYLEHATLMMKLLPKATEPSDKHVKQILYQQLPLAFSRAEGIGIGKKAGHGERTIDRWLGEWVNEKMLIKPKAGAYQKPE